MAITVKKFCEICGVELEEEVVYTCTKGVVEQRKGCFCLTHRIEQGDREKPTADSDR